jgi:lipopolysaccharide biosynthesis regulator YciM
VDPGCVRASLIAAELAATREDHRAAITHLRRVESQDAALLPVALTMMRACHEALGERDQLIEYLDGAVRRRPSGHLTAALAELREAREGPDAAEAFLVEALRRSPSVAGLRQLVDLKLRQGDGDARAQLATLFEVSRPLLDASSRYRCGQCGFEGRSLHWRCPGCQGWNVMRPREDADCGTGRRGPCGRLG